MTVGARQLGVQTEGVVNYPSDNGTSDHYGERVVSNALGVFSTPLERATEWLAPPGTQTISLTESATLEVFARDPDGLHLDLLANHNGHGVLNLFDRGDGSAFVTYEPDINDRGTVTLIIEAYTSQGLDGQIQFELMVHNEGDDPEEPTSNEPERSNDADMLSEEESDAELPETDHPEDASAPSLDEDISRSDYGYTSTGGGEDTGNSAPGSNTYDRDSGRSKTDLEYASGEAGMTCELCLVKSPPIYIYLLLLCTGSIFRTRCRD